MPDPRSRVEYNEFWGKWDIFVLTGTRWKFVGSMPFLSLAKWQAKRLARKTNRPTVYFDKEGNECEG